MHRVEPGTIQQVQLLSLSAREPILAVGREHRVVENGMAVLTLPLIQVRNPTHHHPEHESGRIELAADLQARMNKRRVFQIATRGVFERSPSCAALDFF